MNDFEFEFKCLKYFKIMLNLTKRSSNESVDLLIDFLGLPFVMAKTKVFASNVQQVTSCLMIPWLVFKCCPKKQIFNLNIF